MRKLCEVQDCNGKVVSHGLCDKHRKRLARHGHLRKTRPVDWGKREKHPLYHTWNWMKRMEHQNSLSDDWQDFWKFVEDIGDRPSSDHQLRRKDNKGQYSKENCKWTKIIRNQDKAEYQKQWRKKNPDKAKNIELRKNYGITLEDYNRMYEEHNGCCAICGRHSDEEHFALAVDHNHNTNAVRGLLCGYCNRALGGFQDSVDILSKAIDYLTKYAK